MKFKRNRYQFGTLRKKQRSQGFAWEFRYYVTTPEGERKQITQTFDPAQYPTEADVRKAIEPHLATINSNNLRGTAAATVSTVIDRFYADKNEYLSLSHSTQQTTKSLLELHIRPKWGDVRPSKIKSLAVQEWYDDLPVGAASKSRARKMMVRLINLAMHYEYMPDGVNPLLKLKVKGATKRAKKETILMPEQFKALLKTLPEPYNLMVLISGWFGFRVSETLALKWIDFDFEERTVTINRVFTHSRIKELPKTDESGEALPVHPKLIPILKAWRKKQEEGTEWVFPSPRTGCCYSDSTILTDYIKPAAAKLGLTDVGWHTFRHSYISWLKAKGADLAHIKQLSRHADITTTANIYGRLVTEEMRAANAMVVGDLV